jgi:SecD/SecF fusion protein
VISAPSINEPITGGSAQISGSFQEAEVRNLASALENPLQNPVTIEEERSVSSFLGGDAIKSGVAAGVGGLALVLIFVVIYYRFAGAVAIVGLIANIIILFGVMCMFNFVLTLPGIAGIILTIGLAVDANVLIYERLREEMDAGKPLATALTSAYDKAFTVIFDANATTLITAAILFARASGPVKGFAVTLIVGVIASVFSAMIVTRVIFSWALHFDWLKAIKMLHIIPTGKNFNFLGRRFLWIGISVSVIIVSMSVFWMRGDKNFGVDFKGGDLLVFSMQKSVSVADVRNAIEPLELGETVVQKETSVNKEFISVRCPSETGSKVEAAVMKALPDAGLSVDQRDHVGTLVGKELATGSVIAFGLGVLGILAYVTIRFEFAFAVGAIVALLHDVLITVGVFALFGRELSLIMVGAILTIAGYSINDTIVVYDRIREGLKSGRRGSVQDIMNASINETLSRTLLTSGCTFLSVAALFFFGGPVLHDFAFAILIGIIVGTYSSIFIASPIVLWWSGHKGQSLRTELSGGDERRVVPV